MEKFLEDYTLLDQIGRGGFAQVCKVRHNKYHYIRAVKILDQAIIKGEEDETWIKFRNECKTLLNIGNGNHPHIIHIYQPLLRGMQAFVEMDYIDGRDVSHILRESPCIAVDEVIRLARDISSALAYCHYDIFKFCMDKEVDHLQDDPEDGTKPLLDEPTIQRLVHKYRVTHNDIHSGNIMRRESGDYVLLDFGLSLQDGEVLKTSKHKNGAIEYKAPEKWMDRREADTITPATDVYSLGVVLYEYLTGQVPFPADPKAPEFVAAHDVGEAHKNTLPPPLFEARKACFERVHPDVAYTEPDYPQWLENVIMRCLEKEPTNRFADGKELNNFIEESLAEAQRQLGERMTQLLEERDALGCDVDRLTAQLEKSQGEQEELLNKLTALTQRMAELEQRVKDPATRPPISPEVEKMRAYINKLRHDMEELRKNTNTEKMKMSAEYQKQIKELTDRCTDLDKRLNDATKAAVAGGQKNSAHGGTKWRVMTWILFLLLLAGIAGAAYYYTTTQKRMSRISTDAIDDVNRYVGEIEGLESELNDANERIQRLNRELDRKAMVIHDTVVVEREVTVEKIVPNESDAILQGENKQLRKQNRSLQDTNDQLRQQVKKQQDELERYKRSSRNDEQTIKDLRRDINKLNNLLDNAIGN